MSDNLPRMDYRQHRRTRRLVHECCNYDGGNCLLLDDGSLACASRAFPFPSCAAGSVWLSCPLTGSWPQPSYTGGAGNGAPSAARLLSPNPTGGNTAPTAPPEYAAAKKPSDSANATTFLRI